MSLYAALLFFVLTPDVLVSLPGSKSVLVTAAFHAGVFGLVWALTHKLVWHTLSPHLTGKSCSSCDGAKK